MLDRSPMERLEPPPLGKARERVLTDEELKEVYTYACNRTDPLQRLVYLLIRTGQRVGQMRHLKWTFIGEDRIEHAIAESQLVIQSLAIGKREIR